MGKQIRNFIMPGKEIVMDQVGCTKCRKGEWEVYTGDGKWAGKCTNCGHIVSIPPPQLNNEPDKIPIPMKYFT